MSQVSEKNWQVFCATRVSEKFEKIESLNATPIGFNDEEKIKSIFDEDLYILSTAPPDNGKDPIVENYGMSVFFLIFTIIPIAAGLLMLAANNLIVKMMHGIK